MKKHSTVAQHSQPKTWGSISKCDFLKKTSKVQRDEIQKGYHAVITATEICILLFAKSSLFLMKRTEKQF